jgi:hypothetical protein
MNDRAPTTQLIEVFLLVEQPRQRLGHWTQALAALDAATAPQLSAIHAYYDPTCDQALVELRYDEAALGPSRLGFVVEVALLAEVGMVQPDELSEGERMRFLGERLARCKVQVTYQRSVAGALVELVKRIKEHRSPRPVPPPVPKIARGTRNEIERIDDDAAPEPATPYTTSRHVISRKALLSTAEMDPATAASLVQASREEHERALASPTFDGVGAAPYVPAASGAAADVIYARYLRSGRWVPIRVGSLSLKGAAMMTGALPRLHDHVDIALSFGSCRALVRGAVGKVSTVREAAATGASTFSVQFELDPPARKQLTQLLTAARAAKVTIKPPPARATRRFPVAWPICLGTVRGAVKAEALDVSAGGMFVRPGHPLQRESILNFAVSLDDSGTPVSGRAKVVRHIGDTLAKTCGIPWGYGLGILDMAESDRMRWLAFLARVERRAEKRVLVGAAPERLAELQQGLAGCGYAVTGGSDPSALLQLARADDRPADAALIDAGWLANGVASSWVESLFSARNVPFVTLQGDARRARQAIDRLLEVVV